MSRVHNRALSAAELQSFGDELDAIRARVLSQVGAADARVSTLVAIAPPVNGYDFAGLRESAKPKFLIHGERDEMSPIKGVRLFYGSLSEPRELVVIEDANHVFDGHASEIADAVFDLLE